MKNNKKIKSYMIFTIFTVMMLLISGCSNNAELNENNNDDNMNNKITSDNSENVVVYFFWGDGCPHCATEKPFLEELENKYGDEIEVKMFETWKNPENAKLFQEVAQAYGTTAQGVPTTFIGEKHWVGYADYMGQEMEAKIKSCIDTGCINPGDKLR